MKNKSTMVQNNAAKLENASYGIPACLPFLIMFCKAFFDRVVKTQDCIGKPLSGHPAISFFFHA